MESTSVQNPLTLSDEALQFLTTSRMWALFLSIMGFLGAGLMVLMGAFMGLLGSTMMPEAEGASPFVSVLFGLFYMLGGALYALPSWFLLRFSTNMKEAIVARAEVRLTESFRHLRSYLAFTGIVVIVALVLVFVGILVAVGLAIVAATNAAG